MGKARKVVNKVPLVSRYEAKAMSWCLANEFVVDFQASRMDNGTVKSVSIILIRKGIPTIIQDKNKGSPLIVDMADFYLKTRQLYVWFYEKRNKC